MINELIKCDGCGLFIAAGAYDFHILRCSDDYRKARATDLAIAADLKGKLCMDCPPDGTISAARCLSCPRSNGGK